MGLPLALPVWSCGDAMADHNVGTPARSSFPAAKLWHSVAFLSTCTPIHVPGYYVAQRRACEAWCQAFRQTGGLNWCVKFPINQIALPALLLLAAMRLNDQAVIHQVQVLHAFNRCKLVLGCPWQATP